MSWLPGPAGTAYRRWHSQSGKGSATPWCATVFAGAFGKPARHLPLPTRDLSHSSHARGRHTELPRNCRPISRGGENRSTTVDSAASGSTPKAGNLGQGTPHTGGAMTVTSAPVSRPSVASKSTEGHDPRLPGGIRRPQPCLPFRPVLLRATPWKRSTASARGRESHRRLGASSGAGPAARSGSTRCRSARHRPAQPLETSPA